MAGSSSGFSGRRHKDPNAGSLIRAIMTNLQRKVKPVDPREEHLINAGIILADEVGSRNLTHGQLALLVGRRVDQEEGETQYYVLDLTSDEVPALVFSVIFRGREYEYAQQTNQGNWQHRLREWAQEVKNAAHAV